MVKNQYEGYEYIDPNHQYTYPSSTVLINKQNITNIEEAYRNEHLFVTRRLADLRLKTIEVYSISDILAIHKYLFQDVYAWAGQFRKVNISKNGNPFMSIQSSVLPKTISTILFIPIIKLLIQKMRLLNN